MNRFLVTIKSIVHIGIIKQNSQNKHTKSKNEWGLKCEEKTCAPTLKVRESAVKNLNIFKLFKNFIKNISKIARI